MPQMIQKGTGKPVEIADEHVEFWQSLGYRVAEPDKPEKKPAPRRRSAAKK